jgi:ATP-binding cassette subfamily F protein 3
MILVSHDRHLLRVTVDTLLLVDGGSVAPFDGELDDYPAWLAARDPDAGPIEPGDRQGNQRKQQRRDKAEQRKALQPLRNRLKVLEQQLERLERRRRELDQCLVDSALYAPESKPRLLALLEEQRQVGAALGEAEGEWLALGEELERLQAELA